MLDEWLTRVNGLCVLLSLCGGLLFGINIGYVPAAIYMDAAIQNCTSFTHQSACLSLKGADCIWVGDDAPPNQWGCHFRDWPRVNCTVPTTQTSCEDLHGAACVFDHHSMFCRHEVGWTALEQGIFAGAMMVGAAFGAIGAGLFATRFGRRPGAGLAGVIGFVAAAAEIATWQVGSYGGLVAARVIVGIAVAVAAVVCPMYVQEMTIPGVRPTIAVLFQTAVALGIFASALLLLAISPDPSTDTSGLEYVPRLHVFHAITAATSIGLALVAKTMPESVVWHARYDPHTLVVGSDASSYFMSADRRAALAIQRRGMSPAESSWSVPSGRYLDDDGVPDSAPLMAAAAAGARAPTRGSQQSREPPSAVDAAANSGVFYGTPSTTHRHSTLRGTDGAAKAAAEAATIETSEARPWPSPHVFAVATAIAAMLQLTGINAVINYAPAILAQIGQPAVEGNLCLAAWYFGTTLLAFPLSRVVAPRTAYLASGIIASTCCVIAGIAASPSVGLSGSTQLVLGGGGLLGFTAAFHAGTGPFFYLLSQSVFPAPQREFGASVTQMMQFAFNTLVNFGFPVTAQAISGGPSGNQNEGLSVMFFVFAACGFVTAACLAFLTRARPVSLTVDRAEVDAASSVGGSVSSSRSRAAVDSPTATPLPS